MENKTLFFEYYNRKILKEGQNKNQAQAFYNKNVGSNDNAKSFQDLVKIDKSKNNKYLPLITYFHLIEDIDLQTLELTFNKFLEYENNLKILTLKKGKPLYDNKDINFIRFQEKVDAIEGDKSYNLNKSEQEQNARTLEQNSESELVWKNDRYKVYLADSKQKCIKFSKGYSFCIGYTDSGNQYNRYRYSEQYTHYFVFDNNPNIESEKVVVVQVSNENKPQLTDGKNNTGYKEFNTYLDENPELKEDIFKPIDLSDKEKEIYNKYKAKNNLSDDEFDNLDDIELQYIFEFSPDLILTVNQFSKLSSSLRNEYIGNGLPVSNEIYDLLKDNEKKRLNTVVDQLIENNNYIIVFEKYSEKVIVNNLRIMNNSEDKNGSTPLHYASIQGHEELAKKLLANGADVNHEDKNEYIPLYYAIQNNNTDIAKLLINNGADVNFKDYRGVTPLHIASKNGTTDIAKILINKGVDINTKTEYDDTPLDYAIDYDNIEIIKLLLNYGAESNEKSLEIAIKKSNTELAKLLIANLVDVNLRDKEGKTPLYIAIDYDNIEIIKLLIDNGADINVKDKYGVTPLNIASSNNNTDIVKLLIANSEDKNNNSALINASVNGNIEIAKLLLANGADINTKNKEGNTPLYFSIYFNHQKMVNLLLDNGAEVNEKDLIIAQKKGNQDIVELLSSKLNKQELVSESYKKNFYRFIYVK